MTNFLVLAQPQAQAVATWAPLAVANERVQKTPPCTSSEDMSVTIKQAKTDIAGSRGRTWLSDFNDLTKSLVDETITIYQAQIITV